MQEIQLGAAGKLFFDNNPAGQVLRIERSTTMYIFERATIINPAFSRNALGLYTLVPVGRDGEAVFGSFSTPEFNLRPRAKRCTWNPSTCGVNFGVERIPTCPLEYKRELCTDVLWDSCWEKLLGIGNGIYDWNSTQEAGLLLARAINKEMQGIGNDFWLLMTFGGHPYIEMANNEKWYRLCGISEEKWNCFYEMMMACGGHITIADHLKHVDKLSNFSYEIPDEHISADGTKFTGDSMDLFDHMKENAPAELNNLSKLSISNGNLPVVGIANQNMQLIMGVTESIFNRYKKQLRDRYTNIPEGFYLTVYGEDHGCSTCGNRRLKGVLEYDGCLIVCMHEWSTLDRMTCIKQHRAMLMAPQVLGIAYDVSPDQQFTGMGMKITRWNMDPHMGKTYMSATFRAGAAILDPNYIYMASKIVEPTAKMAA